MRDIKKYKSGIVQMATDKYEIVLTLDVDADEHIKDTVIYFVVDTIRLLEFVLLKESKADE